MSEYEFTITVRYRITAPNLAVAEQMARLTTDMVRMQHSEASDVDLLHILALEPSNRPEPEVSNSRENSTK